MEKKLANAQFERRRKKQEDLYSKVRNGVEKIMNYVRKNPKKYQDQLISRTKCGYNTILDFGFMGRSFKDYNKIRKQGEADFIIKYDVFMSEIEKIFNKFNVELKTLLDYSECHLVCHEDNRRNIWKLGIIIEP